MLSAIKSVVDSVFQLLSMPLNIDNYTFSFWQIYLLFFVFVVISYILIVVKRG